MKKRPKQDRATRNYLILTMALAAGAMIFWVTLIRKPAVEPVASSVVQQTAEATPQHGVPPYYASVDAARPFPKLIPAAHYHRYPLVERAYNDAAEIPGVLAQQPYYCYCDRVGHHSLLDCYASDHAAHCLICIKEGLLAKQMTQQSKTPVEIRQAIIRGEWQNVDVGAAAR